MKRIAIPFLLSLTPMIATGFVPASASSDSFLEKLNALTEQVLEYPSINLKAKLTTRGSSIQDETLAGIKLGAKLDDVVALMGKPKLINMQTRYKVQLTFFNSIFLFENGELRSMSFHSADLPNLVLKEGISFRSKIVDLQKIFPNGKVEESILNIKIFTVGINSRLNARFQLSGGEVISIQIERP